VPALAVDATSNAMPVVLPPATILAEIPVIPVAFATDASAEIAVPPVLAFVEFEYHWNVVPVETPLTTNVVSAFAVVTVATAASP